MMGFFRKEPTMVESHSRKNYNGRKLNKKEQKTKWNK